MVLFETSVRNQQIVAFLFRYGAYSAYEIYTTDEVQDLIKFAQVRGVRVLLEIDSPGHAGYGWQWGKVRSNISCIFMDESRDSIVGRTLVSYVSNPGFYSRRRTCIAEAFRSMCFTKLILLLTAKVMVVDP